MIKKLRILKDEEQVINIEYELHNDKVSNLIIKDGRPIRSENDSILDQLLPSAIESTIGLSSASILNYINYNIPSNYILILDEEDIISVPFNINNILATITYDNSFIDNENMYIINDTAFMNSVHIDAPDLSEDQKMSVMNYFIEFAPTNKKDTNTLTQVMSEHFHFPTSSNKPIDEFTSAIDLNGDIGETTKINMKSEELKDPFAKRGIDINIKNKIGGNRTHYLKWSLTDGLSIRYFFTFQTKKNFEGKFIIKDHDTKENQEISQKIAEIMIKKLAIKEEEIVGVKHGKKSFKKVIMIEGLNPIESIENESK